MIGENWQGSGGMKALLRAVDRFCGRHPRFGIPNLMLYVVIANGIVWLFQMMDSTGTLTAALVFSPYHILRGEVWRLFTFAMLPFGGGFLVLITFYFYYFIGRTIEREWGSGKFTLYFLSGLLLTAVYGFVVYLIQSAGLEEAWKEMVSLVIASQMGAYYIYLSMFFTFALLYPDMQVLLFFVIPVKMKWLGLLDLGFFLYEVVTTPFPYDLLPVVAVLNCLVFCWDALSELARKIFYRPSGEAVQFRTEVRRMQQEERSRNYTRRCEVCGRTDADYPELEFRYCSRCRGYHCYCIDHINAHRHVTD